MARPTGRNVKGFRDLFSADLLLNDRPLLVCVTLWVVAVVLIIYHPLMP